MRYGLPEQSPKKFYAVGVTPGDVGCAADKHQLGRVHGKLLGPQRCGLALEPLWRCRRVLTRREAVDAVVVEDEGYVDVPLGSEHEMIQPFGQGITIPRATDHLQIGVGKLYRCCHRESPAVNGVEAVHLEVIHYLSLTAYAGDQDHIVYGESFVV
ncbi:Uncharacterised protein [uncultured archaeon]|nr:Uncharacterised protein [uncultured archaeon]